jgi:hypothetical protein
MLSRLHDEVVRVQREQPIDVASIPALADLSDNFARLSHA